jgi:hypothetical protein
MKQMLGISSITGACNSSLWLKSRQHSVKLRLDHPANLLQQLKKSILPVFAQTTDGCLLFGQVPLVEIDGMMLTQTRAILSYLAAKYNLYGKDLKERLRYYGAHSYT